MLLRHLVCAWLFVMAASQDQILTDSEWGKTVGLPWSV
jgi:hypothetical protein